MAGNETAPTGGVVSSAPMERARSVGHKHRGGQSEAEQNENDGLFHETGAAVTAARQLALLENAPAPGEGRLPVRVGVSDDRPTPSSEPVDWMNQPLPR